MSYLLFTSMSYLLFTLKNNQFNVLFRATHLNHSHSNNPWSESALFTTSFVFTFNSNLYLFWSRDQSTFTYLNTWQRQDGFGFIRVTMFEKRFVYKCKSG